MAKPVPDGLYTLGVPFGNSHITDTGKGRYLSLLPHGALGDDADKIKAVYKPEKGAYSLQFEKSKEYLTWEGDEPQTNNKLVTGNKPRYFRITQHPYEHDKYIISAAENQDYHVGPALERIYPPWVALLNFPEKQAWAFEKA